MAGALIREARNRGGLTQAELARRLGTSQPAIGRWERGEVEPSLSNLRRAVRACGLDLRLGLRKLDDSDLPGIDHALRLTPAERVQGMLNVIRLMEERRRLLAGRNA